MSRVVVEKQKDGRGGLGTERRRRRRKRALVDEPSRRHSHTTLSIPPLVRRPASPPPLPWRRERVFRLSFYLTLTTTFLLFPLASYNSKPARRSSNLGKPSGEPSALEEVAMSADAAVLAAVSALAQSPLRPGVLDDVADVATVAQLRKQVSDGSGTKRARKKKPITQQPPRVGPPPTAASTLPPFPPPSPSCVITGITRVPPPARPLASPSMHERSPSHNRLTASPHPPLSSLQPTKHFHISPPSPSFLPPHCV